MFSLVAPAIASLVTFGALSARVSTRRTPQVSFAGIPVFNYDDSGEVLAQDAPREWNIVFTDLATGDHMAAVCAEVGCLLQGHDSSIGVPFVAVSATTKQLMDVAKKDDGNIDFFEPDMPVYEPVGLEDSETQRTTTSAIPWHLEKINRHEARHTGKGSTVYVLDSGVRDTHSEFGGRAKNKYDVFQKQRNCDGWWPRPKPECGKDGRGHGTHVAGLAAGASYGVAFGAKIRGIRVINSEGGGSSAGIAAGVDFAVALARKSKNRPAVLSMSLGLKRDPEVVNKAVSTAYKNGITFVVAAGNENVDACKHSPGKVTTVITVGATTSLDNRWSWSNWGSCVNIWAPGVKITSAGHESDSDDKTKDGSSMATPLVSGAVAVMLEGSSSLNPDAVRTKLLGAASRDKIGYGLSKDDTNLLLNVQNL